MDNRKYVAYDRVVKLVSKTQESLRLQRMYAASSEIEMLRQDIAGIERVEIQPEVEQVCNAFETYAVKAIAPFFQGAKIGHEVLICKRCGNRFRAGDVYCSFCGRRLVRNKEGKSDEAAENN